MAVPWLWLYGPPGVGKSATGYELFDLLATRGARVAFTEIDQIGMCMPAPDEARSAAKADNLLGMLDNFGAVGVDGVIVSGDIVETMADVLTRAQVRPVLCRLRADDDVAVDRLAIREGLQYAMPSSVYESYGVPAGDVDVTTHPLGVDGVAEEIVRRLGSWPPVSLVADAPGRLSSTVIEDCSAVLVTGPRAVGTSMAAWQVLMASVASGHRTGYVDLEQLGFLPRALHRASLATKLANMATCWEGFRNQDTERLVVCGHVDDNDVSVVRELLPSICVVALTAAPDRLLARAERRRRHKDVWLPGDDLYGCDDADVCEIARRAEHFEIQHADLVINTDGLTPTHIARRITQRWPSATTA